MKNKRKVLFWICLIVFLIAVAFLIGWFWARNNRENVYEKMQSHNEEWAKGLEKETSSSNEKIAIPIDFQSLQKENKDICAWIKIPGTEVDYPILRNELDDDYYLEHTVEGKEGLPGSIYMESLNSPDFKDINTVIYGHDMKDGSMFGKLELYKDSSYMKENSKVLIYTPEHIYTYTVFAAVTYDNRHLLYSFDFSKEEGLSEFLDSINSVRNMNSCFDEKINVKSSDKIITLSTCNGIKTQRFLVEAVLIDEQ